MLLQAWCLAGGLAAKAWFSWRACCATLPVLLLAAVLAMGALGSAPALGQGFTRQQMQDTYLAHLKSEGFQPELTEAGNVRFVRKDLVYIIYVDTADPMYFRLVLAFEEDDKSPAARTRRIESAHHATATVRVVKVYLDGDGDPNFAAEMFIVIPGDFRTVLARTLQALDEANAAYQKKYEELR